MSVVNWSGLVGRAGVAAGVIVLVGVAHGLVHDERSVADEVAAVPAVSTPPRAAVGAYVCAVSCPGFVPPVDGPGTLAEARAVAIAQRAADAYWVGQRVIVSRSAGR